MNFIHSIKFRFTLWYLLILAATLILLCAGVYFLLSQTLYRSLDDSLQKDATEMSRSATVYEDISRGDIKQPPRDLLMLCFYSGDELVRISDKNRYILDDETVKQVIRDKRLLFTANSTGEEKLRCFGTQLPRENEDSIPRIFPREGEKRPVVLIVGRPVAQIEESLNELLRVFIIAIPACLAIAGGGGIFLSRRVLKLVDTITQTALEIEESDLGRRIDVKTKDELGRLALTLNQMIGRLEKAFQRQKEFTSDASHELRAPLAIIQAESTLALQKDRDASSYRQSLETVSQEVENMAKIIDQLLMLARSDAGKSQLIFEEINLAEVLQDLTSDINVLCQDKGLSLEINTGAQVSIQGDKVNLRRLFLNVLDNAIRYTPHGGIISISLSQEAQTAFVTITDTGVGISKEHIPHIFDRFYRVDKARSRAEGGSGLGLAICRQIVEAHGGGISVASQAGQGSTFSIRLPVNPDKL
jgi:heavy metal sensor kinase